MRRIGIGVLLVALAVTVSSVSAHHSFARDYFEDQSTSIEGTVEEFQYKNPHAILKVLAPDERGAMVSYAAEWAGAGRLGRSGISPETLRQGDSVRITGSPGRVASERRIHLKQIVRPSDGWSWGTSRGRRR